jgi:hypothetical protein
LIIGSSICSDAKLGQTSPVDKGEFVQCNNTGGTQGPIARGFEIKLIISAHLRYR